MQTNQVILKKRYFLYMTEFFAGMAVMAVELGASRLLAPYFSSSQIVWTIIIGTIMIAMALGNIWGGKMADKDPNPDRLYLRMLVAAVWIAAIPFLGKYVILLIVGALVLTISTNFLIIAAFLACMIIFVFPLFLLGTVTPSLVKYVTDNLEDNGRKVGTLGAYNTIGSIIGTFLPTFVTIPTVGTAVTFLIFSGVLLILALAYFISTKGKRTACAVTTALFLLCSVFGNSGGSAFWEKNLAYEGESIYNYLQVKETDNSIILSTNVLFGVQSIRMKDEGLTGMYYDCALSAPVMAGTGDDERLDVLILGMGSGTYATQCERYFDPVRIDGVEIDQKITELAYEYFDLSDTAQIATYDGRAYLAAVTDRYDVILVDAYQDITMPFQMSTTEFFTMVAEHLTDNGVMVVNMNMRSDGEGSINEYLADTISGVFSDVCTADVPHTTNKELFASNSGDPMVLLAENMENVSDPELSAYLGHVQSRLEPYTAGDSILTDDKAPVELLGMRVIDEMIQEELVYYKDIFKKEGIGGFLGSFS